MNEALNIIFTGNFPFPNGFAGTKRVQQYIDYLHEQSVSVSVLVLRGKPDIQGNEQGEGLFRGVPYRVIGRDLQPGLRLPISLLRFFCDGAGFLKQRRHPDAVNILFHYGQPTIENIWALLLARGMGFRIVHDLVEDYDLQESAYSGVLTRFKAWSRNRMSRFIPNLSAGLVVISRHLEQKYTGCGVPMIRIPIAAEVSDRLADRLRHNPVRIAYAGTYAAKDGIHILLEAYQKVRKEYPDCVLCLAGGRKSPLGDFPPELTVGVEYAGYLDDAAFYRFLQEADILCMTRMNSAFANAGFPFKLGEYLATGNPVVASRVSNLEEYLTDRQDVMLVEPESVQELSNALLYLLQNADEARRIGLSGQKVCQERFNPQANGEKLLRFLMRLEKK
jgi:glycosyltransferase involved in cell wall biosynthesis